MKSSNAEDEGSGQLLPELKPICVCQKIMNLDDETLECPGCKAPFHPDCMRQCLDIKCVQCKQDLPRKLVYTHKRMQDASLEDPNPAKRARTEQQPIQTQEQIRPKAAVVPKPAYPSLKENPALASDLNSYVTSLRKQNDELAAAAQSKTNQTRKSAKDNFIYALLLGVAEAKLRGETLKNVDTSQSVGKAFWQSALKVCSAIST